MKLVLVVVVVDGWEAIWDALQGMVLGHMLKHTWTYGSRLWQTDSWVGHAIKRLGVDKEIYKELA